KRVWSSDVCSSDLGSCGREPADAGLRSDGGDASIVRSRRHRRVPCAASQAAGLGLGSRGCGRPVSRDPAQRIADVLAAIERCQRYVAALGGDAAVVEMAEDAIERNLQIIGEAVNHLPEDIT